MHPYNYITGYCRAPARLRELRQKRELPQRGLAVAAKITHNAVYRIEVGVHQMTALNAIALSAVLECTPEWLLFGVGEEPV